MSAEPNSFKRTQYRLGFWLLLAPIVLWLGLLIILPHKDMMLVSLQERIT